MLLAFRRIFGRAGLEEKDVRILTGLFRQIEWYANQAGKSSRKKKKAESKFVRRKATVNINHFDLQENRDAVFRYSERLRSDARAAASRRG